MTRVLRLFTTRRVLTVAWVTGVTFVGAVSNASASPNGGGIITGPDLAQGSTPTVFEAVDWGNYSLPFNIDTNQTGMFGLQTPVWTIFNGIETAFMFLAGAVLRGALDLIEWVLQLGGLYRDNAPALDAATSTTATAVFFPLLATTLCIAAFTLYARARRDGAGSIFGELITLLVLGVLAVSIVHKPSDVVGPMDDTRSAISDAVMTGYSAAATPTGSAAGFDPVTVQSTPQGAVRRLADSMWNTFFVSPWCYTAFGDMETCSKVGKDYLTQSDRWAAIDANQTSLGGAAAGSWATNGILKTPAATSGSARCDPAVSAHCDWVRGQTFTRLGGVLLVVLLIILPAALMLLLLALYGIIAVVTFMLLLLLSPLFLVAAMIPGIPRSVAGRYFQALIGSLIQSVTLTAILGAVMVLSAILSTMAGTFGLLLVCVLNLATMVVGLRVRSLTELVGGLGGSRAGGMLAGMVALRAAGGIGRMGKSVARVAGRGARAAAPAAAAGAGTAARAAVGMSRATPAYVSRLNQFRSTALPMPATAATGPAATATGTPPQLGAGARATSWQPRPADYQHREPVTNQGAAAATGNPGGVGSAPITRINPHTKPVVRPTRIGERPPGAPPTRYVNGAGFDESLVVTRTIRPPSSARPRPLPALPPGRPKVLPKETGIGQFRLREGSDKR